jgi:hypothetical protein
LAKVKADDDLFKRSCLAPLENYLASDILNQKRNILIGTVVRNIGYLVDESSKLTGTSLSQTARQLEELKRVDFQNQDLMEKLIADTRDKQTLYMANIESFQASRRVFIVQAKRLIDSFALEKVDAIINNAKHDMAESLTTYGIKQNIRKLFDDLRNLLDDAIKITNETRHLVKTIHIKVKEEYGFEEIEPLLFSIKQYQIELEQIFEQGETFRRSTKMTMTEQSIVINKLYGTLITNARDVLKQAHDDAIAWSQGVLIPIMCQIKDHKKQIESRLLMLKKINSSKGSIAENIVALEAELAPLKRQRDELAIMIKAMQLDSYSADNA